MTSLLCCSRSSSTGPNTWHADASELSDAVEAGGVVLAGHGQTFVDVDFTTWASVTPTTLALEGALRVHTFPKVLAWIGTCGLKDAIWYILEKKKTKMMMRMIVIV